MPPPLRSGAEFVSAASERLTYRISLRGFPVGEAQLAAVNRDGRVKISARLRSSPLAEAFYRVDDTVESELVAGNYIVTTIRQHEGEFSRSAGFTIMLREKKAFSADRLRGRFVTETLPSSEVTDPITGLYFLRNRPLATGETVLLHLYDSGEYSETSVEVLRKERIRVAGLGEVATLVIRPQLSHSGLFSKTGPVEIWLTDDIFRVPVKMKTRIALGEVTAEIISSEVER
jgi:hypothetical protein